MLPTAHRSVDSPRTRRALLCTGSANENLLGNRISLCCSSGKTFSMVNPGIGVRHTLDDQGRRLRPAASTCNQPRNKDGCHQHRRLYQPLSTKAGHTGVAEPSAVPRQPAQPNNLAAAFCAEIWAIACEERHCVRFLPVSDYRLSGAGAEGLAE